MKKTICSIFVLLEVLANAENLFINSSFEKTRDKNPAMWVASPRNNVFAQIDTRDSVSGKNSAKIVVPVGKEGSFLFSQKRKVKIPANTPVKLSGWFKSEKYRAVKGKKSIRGISMRIAFADGTKTYPVLYFRPTDGKWQYKEQFLTFPKEITSVDYVYLFHYNASGTVKYDDLYFGPWTEKDMNSQTDAFVVVPKVEKAPVIDGKLDEECWKNAARLSNFVLMSKEKAFANNQTEVYMAYDASNLYIATRAYARVLDPVNQETTKFRAICKERDSSVFNDDSIEVFLAPDKKTYYHLAYNALGTCYDAEKLEREWNTEWEVKTTLNDKAWLAEISIPWKSLGIQPGKNKDFRFNFCRNEPADKEISAWNPTQNSFHDTNSFARGTLGANTIQVTAENLVLANITLGPKPVDLKLRSNKNLNVDATLTVFQKGDNKFFHKSIEIHPNKSTSSTIDMSFVKTGDYRYNYSIIDKENEELLFRSPLYAVKATLVNPAEIKLNFKGELDISIDGKKLDSNKFFLKKGINNLSIKCSEAGKLAGGVILPKGLDGKPELIEINTDVKDNEVIKRQILLNSTHIEPVWVEQGLHVLRNASQHAPLKIQQPAGKTLELIIPESLSLIGVKDGDKTDFAGLNITVKTVQPKIISGKKYKAYQYIFTGKQKDFYTQGILYDVTADAPSEGCAIYFRVISDEAVEVWNKVAVKAMPAIKGKRPKILGVDFWHAFGVGSYNQEQADVLYKSFGDLGFNSVTERVLCYGEEKFYKAAKKAGLKVFAEFHMSHQFRPLFVKYPEFRGVDIQGRRLSSIQMQPMWFCGAGRKEAIKIIADYVRKYKPYGIQIDFEVNPFHNADVSPSTLEAFAKYAKLSKVPDKKELKGKYRDKWVDFVCRTWGKIAEVFKAGTVAGNPETLFSIYASYQSPHLFERYSCNWNYLRDFVDVAMMGYGAQTEKIRRDTLDALKGVPAYFGVVFWQQNAPGYGKLLKNVFIRRIIDGGNGVMQYTWCRLEGISKTKIAEACNILSEYEPFFAGHDKEMNFSVSGDFSSTDIVILKHKGQKLIVAFNPRRTKRKGIIKVDGKTIKMEAEPYDVNVKLVK